jgi:hypothetical protein
VPLLQVSPAGQSDDKATFLAEFRALRDRAALDYEELAARTHFPSDVLKDAENGPGLPGLPVLAAYVRACGGDVTDWEERWRRLARAAEDEAGLPTRPAGSSAAAKAGARAGVTVGPAEAHDTERIKAALRAHRKREENENRAKVAQTATMVANGSHHKQPRVFETMAEAATPQASAATVGNTEPAAPAPAPAVEQDEAFQVLSEPETSGSELAGSASVAAASAGSLPGTTGRATMAAGATRLGARVSARNRNLTSRPGLLALIVVGVLAVCIALLALT